METTSTGGGIQAFIHNNPTAAMGIVAAVAVLFVMLGGKKSNPNNTPVTVDQSPGKDYVSNQELINALQDQRQQILDEVQAGHNPRTPGVPPPGGPGGEAAGGGWVDFPVDAPGDNITQLHGYMGQWHTWSMN